MEHPWGYRWMLFDYRTKWVYTEYAKKYVQGFALLNCAKFTHTIKGYFSEIQAIWMHVNKPNRSRELWPLLLTWINFNPSMDN